MTKNKNQRPKWIVEHIDPTLAESKLFRFKVKLSDGEYTEVDVLQDLDIDYDLLETHLEHVPAQYMFWASIYSELRSMVSIIELKIRARRNKLAVTIIEEYKERSVRLTDKQMNSLIDGDDGLIRLEVELASAQKHVGKCYHMVEAIKIKSDSCRSLSGFKRQELEQSSKTT